MSSVPPGTPPAVDRRLRILVRPENAVAGLSRTAEGRMARTA